MRLIKTTISSFWKQMYILEVDDSVCVCEELRKNFPYLLTISNPRSCLKFFQENKHWIRVAQITEDNGRLAGVEQWKRPFSFHIILGSLNFIMLDVGIWIRIFLSCFFLKCCKLYLDRRFPDTGLRIKRDQKMTCLAILASQSFPFQWTFFPPRALLLVDTPDSHHTELWYYFVILFRRIQKITYFRYNLYNEDVLVQ